MVVVLEDEDKEANIGSEKILGSSDEKIPVLCIEKCEFSPEDSSNGGESVSDACSSPEYHPAGFKEDSVKMNYAKIKRQQRKHELKSRAPEISRKIFTKKTFEEWIKLRIHIRRGCLSDPVSGQLYLVVKQVKVGNRTLPLYSTARGTTQLEGFHRLVDTWITGHRVSPKVWQAQFMLYLVAPRKESKFKEVKERRRDPQPFLEEG